MKKRNKLLIIISIVFVIIAIIVMIIGLALQNFNFIKFFTGDYAILFYIVFGLYVTGVLFIFVGDWIKKI